MGGKQSECGEQAGPGLFALLPPEAFAGPVWSLLGLWRGVRGGVAVAPLSYPLDISIKGLSPTLGEAGVCNPALPPSSPTGGKRKQKPSGAGREVAQWWRERQGVWEGAVWSACLPQERVSLLERKAEPRPASGVFSARARTRSEWGSEGAVLYQGGHPLQEGRKGLLPCN